MKTECNLFGVCFCSHHAFSLTVKSLFYHHSNGRTSALLSTYSFFSLSKPRIPTKGFRHLAPYTCVLANTPANAENNSSHYGPLHWLIQFLFHWHNADCGPFQITWKPDKPHFASTGAVLHGRMRGL